MCIDLNLIINLTYYHVADDVPANEADIAIVIDVLRATTTISWALKNGADSIQVFSDLDLLKATATVSYTHLTLPTSDLV